MVSQRAIPFKNCLAMWVRLKLKQKRSKAIRYKSSRHIRNKRMKYDAVSHVHLLVSWIPLKVSVSRFMVYLKGKSAMMIFEKHANLKYKFGNRNF